MSTPIKVLIADDEQLARQRVAQLISAVDPDTYIEEASSGKEAVTTIETWRPDVVFLDIQMTDMTGFDVIEHLELEQMPIIVFVTAFDHFAVQAFEVKAIDFLLKPYKSERFEEAYHRAIEQHRSQQQGQMHAKIADLVSYMRTTGTTTSDRRYLQQVVIRLGKKYLFVSTANIKYITSSAYYAEIHTVSGEKHIYRISMTDFMSRLDPERFIRVNRSTIIAISEIKEVISEGQGEFSIVMKDKQAFSLSRNYKPAFMQQMNIKSN